jgi:hypothetical protein
MNRTDRNAVPIGQLDILTTITKRDDEPPDPMIVQRP